MGYYSDDDWLGLKRVGEIEWSGDSYSFDLTGVWVDPRDGELYWGDDSGCSCPSPFEDVYQREQIEHGPLFRLRQHLTERYNNRGGEEPSTIEDVRKLVEDAMRAVESSDQAIEAKALEKERLQIEATMTEQPAIREEGGRKILRRKK